MKEIIEFRISNDYAHLLLKSGERKRNDSNTIIRVTKNDPEFEQIKILNKQVKERNNDFLFLYSSITRTYKKKELDTAKLLRMKINSMFEPAGEECGTLYDETFACEICGANRKQVSALKLKKGSLPKKDVARSIAGEVVVSEKFGAAVTKNGLKGILLTPVLFDKTAPIYYQLTASAELELTKQTVAGVNIFDLSEMAEAIDFMVSDHHVKLEKEVYKCPKGHTIGLNILSELYVSANQSIADYDFFASKQKIGVKRGLLRPEPLYLCSPAFRKMLEEENLSGFDFEVAHIV